MSSVPCILIFDVGKTNKKLLLFDEDYNLVFEESMQFEEISDESGFPCEHIHALGAWVISSYRKITSDKRFDIKAVNFSAYGASLVYLDQYGEPLLPLYNYLKPYPEKLQEELHKSFGGTSEFARCTASPVLGSLNSGLQLYRIKKEKPEVFTRIRTVLHLPQYLSFLITKTPVSEITSIGCHTALWNFDQNRYHEWVSKEGLLTKLPALSKSDDCILVKQGDKSIPAGIGLHDSSAALIPYQLNFRQPFILLSTGTWCISLNPFDKSPLTQRDLKRDSLCYLTYKGDPVKASRLFTGYEHEHQVKRLAQYYGCSTDFFNTLEFNMQHLHSSDESNIEFSERDLLPFKEKDLRDFANAEHAYHELMTDIVIRQMNSTKLVQNSTVKTLFVDGGFSRNDIFMHLMGLMFPELEVFAASVPQASALGAALAIHKHWNKKTIPSDIITLKHYSDAARVGRS